MAIAVCYGIGASAFMALVVLMLINRRPSGFGLRILLACLLTAAWAAAAAWPLPYIAHALESIRSGAWLFLLASVLAQARKGDVRSRFWQWLPLAAAVAAALSAANDLRHFSPVMRQDTFTASQVVWRIILAVGGLLIVENLIRNTPTRLKWHLFPLCIAIGMQFAYDLFVFAEAVVLQKMDPLLLAGRGIVLALIVPPLILTMARNPNWRIDIHISRQVVFHTATLMASGTFLVVAAGVAALIGRFPGEWATISKIAFFCGSILVLLTVLSTESLRSRLRRIISENFFSTRYDYRAEWVRTIATLSSSNENEPLAARAIRALADVVDSPGGVLWMKRSDGAYGVERTLNMALDASGFESASGAFVAGFRGGEAIQEFGAGALKTARPVWAGASAWLAVPLLKIDRLIGFVALSQPRTPAPVTWESVDLLLAIGQQVAGYLAEERATRTLMESQSLINYSRRFSFAIHDIKNVSGQLAMMIANTPRFGERPEFRADLVRGMESAVRKLGELVDRLRPETEQENAPECVDPSRMIDEVVRELDGGKVPLCVRLAAETMRVRIVPSDLRAILTHLVTNAIEASANGNAVTISLARNNGHAVIDVADHGCGMTPEFVQDGLFVPLHSTKERGLGIGAYQARDLVRVAGGDIEVASTVGLGTTIRISLPDVGGTPAMFKAEMAAQ
jgi:putative PEP-CTERM system histidine kinase